MDKQIPEIPIGELHINSWNPVHTGFVVRQDTHVSITHLATRIYAESSGQRSVHMAKAEAMKKLEKAWVEYWSKPPMDDQRKAFESIMRERSKNDLKINRFGNYQTTDIQIKWNYFQYGFQAALPSTESSAERTLKHLGYTDCGGELWKPPLGSAHAKLEADLADARKDQARYQWVRQAGAWESEVGLDLLSGRPELFDEAVDTELALIEEQGK